jgi:hypothetical protein
VYEVEWEPSAERCAAALPVEAINSLLEVRVAVQLDPWSGAPQKADKPEGNMRVRTFGDGRGMLVYVILDERRLVYIVQLTWM